MTNPVLDQSFHRFLLQPHSWYPQRYHRVSEQGSYSEVKEDFMDGVEASLCLKESWASDCSSRGRASEGNCRGQLSVVGQLSTVGHTLLESHKEMWPERIITTRCVELEGSHHQVCGVSWASRSLDGLLWTFFRGQRARLGVKWQRKRRSMKAISRPPWQTGQSWRQILDITQKPGCHYLRQWSSLSHTHCPPSCPWLEGGLGFKGNDNLGFSS